MPQKYTPYRLWRCSSPKMSPISSWDIRPSRNMRIPTLSCNNDFDMSVTHHLRSILQQCGSLASARHYLYLESPVLLLKRLIFLATAHKHSSLGTRTPPAWHKYAHIAKKNADISVLIPLWFSFIAALSPSMFTGLSPRTHTHILVARYEDHYLPSSLAYQKTFFNDTT